MKNRLWVGILLGMLFILGIGTGYWAYAQPGHGMNNNRHMMGRSRHSGVQMGSGQYMGMMNMPMMNHNMSAEEMDQYCQRMNKWHERKQSMMQKNTERLNTLMSEMKQASSDKKLQAMESVVIELVDQHNNRPRMTGTIKPMMNMMMGMHRMDQSHRQMMMERIQSCPFYREMEENEKEK